MEWHNFFPAYTPVLALPNWQHPRLYIPAHTARERWVRSGFYPAFRLRARLYRLGLRATAAAGIIHQHRTAHAAAWPLGTFVQDVLPGADSISVLLGSPSPTQKTTVQVWNAEGQVIGYVKYAEKPAAQERLRYEHQVLTQLPEGAGPRPLKFGAWGDGEALVTSALPGQPFTPTLPPGKALPAYCLTLHIGNPLPVDVHPWVRWCKAHGGDLVAPWFDALAHRPWPVAVHHGDLVWNLAQDAKGTLRAFDWEYGVPEGFPGQDLAKYLLQVAMEMLNWPVEKGHTLAVDYMHQHSGLDLTRDEALAMVRLAAFDLYRKFEADGFTPDRWEQQWRKAAWEMGNSTVSPITNDSTAPDIRSQNVERRT